MLVVFVAAVVVFAPALPSSGAAQDSRVSIYANQTACKTINILIKT